MVKYRCNFKAHLPTYSTNYLTTCCFRKFFIAHLICKRTEQMNKCIALYDVMVKKETLIEWIWIEINCHIITHIFTLWLWNDSEKNKWPSEVVVVFFSPLSAHHIIINRTHLCLPSNGFLVESIFIHILRKPISHHEMHLFAECIRLQVNGYIYYYHSLQF